MFIDTHCHLNIMVKDSFDSLLTSQEFTHAEPLIADAVSAGVKKLLCVGTSIIESMNCIKLAVGYDPVFATVGIHPNDLAMSWQEDLRQIALLAKESQKHKIVAIGECGLDKHYPGYNIAQQKDAFRAQIELALEYDLALVVHTRDAGDETLECLAEYKNNCPKGTIHCFSEDLAFAQGAIQLGFVLGIGGTITYPKNSKLREVVSKLGIEHIILETDAPFLPPQPIRGKKNSPTQIPVIAQAVADLLGCSREEVGERTTKTAESTFYRIAH